MNCSRTEHRKTYPGYLHGRVHQSPHDVINADILDFIKS